MVVTSEHP